MFDKCLLYNLPEPSLNTEYLNKFRNRNYRKIFIIICAKLPSKSELIKHSQNSYTTKTKLKFPEI